MTPEIESGDATPSPEKIRQALARIAASDEFRASPQLVAFLRFVVEAALAGEGDRIKAYTIGVEAFGRHSSFDPQIDPIVRVEATRLRRTIERYYAGTGAADAVIIELSRGTYVPGFKFRPDGSAAATHGGAAPRKTPLNNWMLLPVATVLLIATGFFGPKVHLEWSSGSPATSAMAARRDSPVLAAGNGMPTLLVQPIEVVGTHDPYGISASSLHHSLSDAFSKFELVNVISEPMPAPHDEGIATPAARADYRFTGSIEYAASGLHIGFRLVDGIDGAVIWSRVFDAPGQARDMRAAEEAIVRELASALIQPFGIIYAHGRRQAVTRSAGDPRYRCVLEAIESFRSFDPKQAAGARACLERLTALDPTFALGWTYLAPLHLREHLLGVDRRADELPALERALRAARRGVELNPASARGYEMLAVALFARHDVAASFAAAEKAASLNPYDMRIVGALGALKLSIGEVDAGMDLLRQAAGDGMLVSPLEQFFLFVGNYLKGDMERASFHASQLTSETFQLGLLARALVACKNGDHDASRVTIERLVALNPLWRQNLRGALQKFFYAGVIVDRLAADLSASGLVQAN